VIPTDERREKKTKRKSDGEAPRIQCQEGKSEGSLEGKNDRKAPAGSTLEKGIKKGEIVGGEGVGVLYLSRETAASQNG